ncbi:TonB-dependent receptor [Arcticibacter svalbardensis MN12-7]|uniref:TonB-dependent receptor n=1 Tax=Arcticibacter svalbardensis MN12-7 TaxID=1150600 RepID=R9GMB9_9SPHI|nr:TonB-dependent receptor [Arcticibacter svalbardensis]EOR92987.1 TonB-dependent receptor [Arcticibacter svalbardensis MN12-7]
MKNYFTIKITGLLIFLTLQLFTASGQSVGKISGKVTDKKTGETLIGLSVKIQGTTKGSSTSVDGRYSLNGLAPGKYILDFSYIGYQTKRVSDITVTANNTTTLDIVMEESSGQQLQQVVINVSARKASLDALYASQKNSSKISDGISADQITRSPDRSTGEVLKRVSGTTIQDNKFVIVRGLSDRYNNASLDNASLPSTEPNRKAFSFDIIPSSLIDNVVVSKTATPDMAGDFAGGSIQIITKDIPEKNFTTINLGTGWNSQSTFKDFYATRRVSSNYLGFDNKRELPANFPTNKSRLDALQAPQRQALLQQFPQIGSINNSKGILSQNHQFTLGRVIDVKNGGRFGLVGSITYSNSETTRPEVERNYQYYDFEDRVNTFSTNVGALLNLSYTKGKNKFAFKNLYNKILEDKFTYREGEDAGKSSDIRYYAFDMNQKGLLKTSIEGEHQPNDVHKINWNASFAKVTNTQPDQFKIGYQRNISDRDNASVPFLASNTALTRENNRLFLDMDENLINASVNDQITLNILSQPAKLKLGIGGQYRQRDFTNRLLGAVLTSFDEDIQSRPINTLYGQDLIQSGAYQLSEIVNGAFEYSADVYTGFGYAMLDNKLGEKSRVVWGVRAEKFNLDIDANEGIAVKKDYLDILPSLNYTYAISPKSNFRASYYRTLARPELREWAPTTYYDYENLYLVKGNSSLERSLIDNADIRYELYPGAGQIFSVSAFYKNFKNAIEPFVDDRTSTNELTYFNTDKAVNYGFELEIRHPLTFNDDAIGFFQNTSLYVNGAYIKSKINNPVDPDDLLIHKTRPMVGQSPYSINAGLQNTSFDDRLNLSLLYNRIGRRIFALGSYLLEDIYEAPRDAVDFQASYWLKKNKAQLKLNVSNLLNTRTLFYFDYTQDKKFSGSETAPDKNGTSRTDEIQARYKSGTNASLSFSYTF